MKIFWQLSLFLVAESAVAQRVVQGSVQHFESLDIGPFLPFVTFGFGTPAQNIKGIFDTGSSDTIIPEAGSAVCQLKTQQCTAPAPVVLGQFDPKATCDFKRLEGQRFNATFAGGDQYDGDYIETTVALGERGAGQVPNAQVALASHRNPQIETPQVPVFGVGLPLIEATDNKYDNIPRKMKDAGVTKGQAYSVVLNSTPFGNGSVFFGGIDRSKFEGELKEVPLEKDRNGEIPEFVVQMTSLKLVAGARGNATRTQERREVERMKRTPWNRVIKTLDQSRTKSLYGGEQGDNIAERTTAVTDVESQLARGVDVSSMKRNNGADNGRNGERNNGGNSAGNNGGNDGRNNRSNNGSNACNGKKVNKGGKNGGNNDGNSGNEIDLGLDPRDGFTLMDTGGVAIALPPAVLSKMADALGTTFSQDGLGPVMCSRLSGDSALVMRFNNDTVEARMPLANMRISDALADPQLTSRGLCELGVRPTQAGDTNVATLPFFAAVYTVFDLDNNRLFFAQAKGDPGAPGGQLEEFP